MTSQTQIVVPQRQPDESIAQTVQVFPACVVQVLLQKKYIWSLTTLQQAAACTL
jgi:hypothetical protein